MEGIVVDINASIIDQRLQGIQGEIAERARSELRIEESEKLKSLAFVYLCVKTMLDLDLDETFDCLTEGSGDFGVDALHISEENDGEFGITLFQCKYKRDLDGEAEFPESGIEALVNAIRHIFDPAAQLGAINDRLRVKVEEARSLIRDGSIPRVRAIACNNGRKWNDNAQRAIVRAGYDDHDQVTWEHVNHDVLVGIIQRPKQVNETLRLTGKALIEDLNYSRVCVGRLPVTEVAALMKTHGDRLLERNIRRYLGLHGNRVNTDIRNTLRSKESCNFYFFNNGLTLVCDDFSYNALQGSDFQIRVENLQIVNGGQTCMTILKTEEELLKEDKTLPVDASVLVRIYKLPKNNEDLVLRITHATNSQNPVDLKDLRANDDLQRRLEQSIQDLRFVYRRKRVDSAVKANEITSGAAAEALLAVWRQKPHQAKFFTREHFGRLYKEIFTDQTNGAQVITAVLLYRIAENHRRRPTDKDPNFVRYASCFIAMQMGRRLLKDLGLKNLGELTHQNFIEAKQQIDKKGEEYFGQSLADVDSALKALYGDRDLSLQQLSATFRRGDLIQRLLDFPVQ